jgi:hypothetical protein
MTNSHLVEIHNHISAKLAAAESQRRNAEQQNNSTSLHYWEGQLQELKALRQYLSEKIDLKTQTYF